MTTSEVFNFTEPIEIDNGIERYEEHIYEPINVTNLNSPGEIRTNINEQDLLALPSKAYLLFEGQLVKADGTAYANADAVALTNNGLLFNRITYQLSNKEIEAVYNPGQATTMLGMLNYANDFQLAQGLNQLWYKDTTLTAVLADNTGLAGAAAGKVILNRIQLLMPNLIPSVTLFNWELPSHTPSENPRYVIVGFQTNRANGDQTVYASIFDHCDLKNMFIMVNNTRYPTEDYDLSFPNQKISRIYREASMLKEKFYGMTELIQTIRNIKSSSIQVQIRATFNTAVPANTQAYALVLPDTIMELKANDIKFNN
ncbi:uncharacterized protein LOC136074418 [Hydra vulgaris]|uniref:Uncharacterized protein LOC136074418 n=1 Tax=Hydra vulgaris TaxID=6087 RepID=A0ABM4B1Y8_HYDVU